MGEVVSEVASGLVRGELVADGAVTRFLGVPYGGPVDGAGRFLPAPPVVGWSGVRDCTAIGPAAPQPALSFGPSERGQVMLGLTAELQASEPQGENCLVLNIWAPNSPSSVGRPVMFSIHGGAHTIGSGSMAVFNGRWLAEHHDVVVVSVNHRLGALGYLFVEGVLGDAYAGSGNVGNLDLVTALAWVRDNIGVFGGDPGNVTIFGQSGGGAKVSTLMAMPAATGLFHRAIVQSGPKLDAITADAAEDTTRALLADLGFGDSRDLLVVPAATLIASLVRVLGSPLGAGRTRPGGRMFGPVMDGVVLPRHPFEPDAPSVSSGVPLLIGTTRDEMRMFTYPNEALDSLDDAGAAATVETIFPGRGLPLYKTYQSCRPNATPAQRLAAVLTDSVRVGSIRMAERKAAHGVAPVWMYRFDYETDALDGVLGSPHGLDIAYTFGNPDLSAMSGSGPDRYQIANWVSTIWTAFARTGNPQTPSLPSWPPYEPDGRATMILDSICHVVNDPDRVERRAWDGLFAGA